MTMKVHRHLDDDLDILRSLLVEMADLVDEQLASAINAVVNGDLELAQKVRADDDKIDAMELKVDRQCQRILARHSPVAVDLRLIITAIKINTDLERIGDHAKNVAKNAEPLVGSTEILQRTRIQDMANVARSIMHDAQDAFSNRDRVLARQVLAHDRKVDRLYAETFDTIVQLAEEHPEDAEVFTHLITMTKAIERIADHSKNIAESVVFLIEGDDIRHRDLQESDEEL